MWRHWAVHSNQRGSPEPYVPGFYCRSVTKAGSAVHCRHAQRPDRCSEASTTIPLLSHNKHSPLVMFLTQIYLAKWVQPDLRPQAHESSLNRQNSQQIQRFSARSLPWASLDDTSYSVMCGACVTLPCSLLYPSLWLLSFHFLYLIAIEYLNFYVL